MRRHAKGGAAHWQAKPSQIIKKIYNPLPVVKEITIHSPLVGTSTRYSLILASSEG